MKNRTIVAVIGDYYHPENIIAEAIENSLAAWLESGSLHIRYTSVERLAEELLSKPDSVILFKDDKLNPSDEHWLSAETEKQMVAYVEDGGGWLAWHSGLASYPQDGAYVSMTRGYFDYHPEQTLVRFDPVGHSIDKAVAVDSSLAFESFEEQYFVQCDEANTTVFLRSSSKDGESIGGWSHSYGKGRVCCLTPAHNQSSLLLPEMAKLLEICVLWCSGAE